MSEQIPVIRVECYAGYRGEETPLRFYFGEHKVEMAEMLDRWLAPDHRYFKVTGDGGRRYIIRNDVASDQWELTMFSAH